MDRWRRVAFVTAGAVIVLSAATAVVTNYATAVVPAWFREPAHSWVVLIGLVTAAAIVALIGVRASSPVSAGSKTLDEARDLLAERVGVQWERETRVRLLADPDPIPVCWKPTKRTVIDRFMNGREGGMGSARSDEVTVLARNFEELKRRRLVLLGEAGSGKTSLAIELLVMLLSNRTRDGPVPILLSLTGWDIETHPELWDWLKVRIEEDYPALRANTAARSLTENHALLPVLDGLDEIPADYRPKVISALNRSLGASDGVVLTCRTDDYADAVAKGDALTGAIVLEAEILNHEAAADYLDSCVPPPQVAAWAPVLDALWSDNAPALATVCATPLGVWLVRTIYIEARRDPAELLGADTSQEPNKLGGYLFEQLVPALLDQDQRRNGLRPVRSPEDVRRWLTYLAVAMSAAGTQELRWWHLRRYPRVHRSRWRWLWPLVAAPIGCILGIMIGAFGLVADLAIPLGFSGLVIGAVLGVSAASQPRPQATVLCWALAALGGLAGLFPVIFVIVPLHYGFLGLVSSDPIASASFNVVLESMSVAGLALGTFLGARAGWLGWRAAPNRADVRLRGRLRALGGALLPGVVLGFAAVAVCAVGFFGHERIEVSPLSITIFSAELGLPLILVATVVYGLIVGFTVWARRSSPLDAAETPISTLRQDRSFAILRAGSWAVLMLIVLGWYVAYSGPDFIGIGLALVLLGGGLCVLARSAWFGYAVAVTRASATGRLPRRLMPFLDDMHRLGLLRAAGATYQFRHDRFQEHLATEGKASESGAR